MQFIAQEGRLGRGWVRHFVKVISTLVLCIQCSTGYGHEAAAKMDYAVVWVIPNMQDN